MNEADWAARQERREQENNAARGLMFEACGWAGNVDIDDDGAMLAWARHYLPKMRAWVAEADRT